MTPFIIVDGLKEKYGCKCMIKNDIRQNKSSYEIVRLQDIDYADSFLHFIKESTFKKMCIAQKP